MIFVKIEFGGSYIVKTWLRAKPAFTTTISETIFKLKLTTVFRSITITLMRHRISITIDIARAVI